MMSVNDECQRVSVRESECSCLFLQCRQFRLDVFDSLLNPLQVADLRHAEILRANHMA